ncbi:MAG: HAMP domain-containing protein [Elusimicrobia bacterium]|nr:HAMP domain-containing protein [Elusimicrobiota bacterium]
MRLKAKVLLAFVPLSALTGALVVTLARRSVHRILTDELAQRVIGRSADVAAGAAQAIAERRESVLLPRLLTFVEQTHASYAVALDASGYVVAHTNVVDRGKSYRDAATRQALARRRPGYAVVGDGPGAVLDVAIPVWKPNEEFLLSSAGGQELAGVVRVGLPMTDALTTETRIVRQLQAVVLAAGAVALALILLLMGRLLKPIRPLTEAAARIGQGRRGVSVAVLSGDELGDLATAFNRMSADLEATTVSKDFLDDILDGMLDALVVLDAEGRVRLANAAARRLADADALAGLGAADGSHSEVEFVARGGERIPLLLSSARLADAEGRPAGRVLVARDIRERKALETRMAQSEKLSAIGQLAAGVAHEINNPLGVILGFAQSACRRIEKDGALELPLRSIEREALRCKDLVQNLLTFSRQDQRRSAPLDLRAATESALVLADTQARIRGVALERALAAEPLMIRANANQIQQIVINLCTNAFDATPRGGRVTVSCLRAVLDGKPAARLEVRDTGTGIPSEIRQRIFDPFFTTKEPGKGTGLGLSLVYELASRHGARVDLETRVGEGTAFFVDFPLEDTSTGATP